MLSSCPATRPPVVVDCARLPSLHTLKRYPCVGVIELMARRQRLVDLLLSPLRMAEEEEEVPWRFAGAAARLSIRGRITLETLIGRTIIVDAHCDDAGGQREEERLPERFRQPGEPGRRPK
jgi:hypothetical protein